MLTSQNRSVFLSICNFVCPSGFSSCPSAEKYSKSETLGLYGVYACTQVDTHILYRWWVTHAYVGTCTLFLNMSVPWKSTSFLKAGRHKVQRARYVISLASASHFLRISLPSFEAAWTSQIQPAACSLLCHSLGVFMFPDEVSGWEQGIVSYGSQLEVYEVAL